MRHTVRAIYYSVIIFFIFLAGCDKIDFLKLKQPAATKTQPATFTVKGTIIAKVNNIPVTLEDLNQEIEAYNRMVPEDKPEEKITTREKKVNYLKEQLVRRALLSQEASDRGLDKDEDVVRALEKTKQELLLLALVRQEAEKTEVTSKEIEDYYNTYKEQLKEPEERRIRQIVVANEQEAKDILIQLLQGTDFAQLARERSKDPSAKNGGDLGFIQLGKNFKQFDLAAFSESLEAGNISSIFKGSDGYYILKLEAKRGGQQRSLSEMWDDIKRGLAFLKQQQRMEELVGRLSRAAKIEIYEGEIK